MRLSHVLKSLLVLLSILLACFAVSKISERASKKAELSLDGPTNPGWQEDWNRMKIEPGVEIPENIQIEWYRELLNSSRSVSNLTNVQEIGPDTVAGRIRAFQIDYSNSNRLLAGGISGGLWESLDEGATWNNLTAAQQFVNITSLTQSPFDHDVFYFTTGESTGNSAGISGQGIFKSTDGGYTFELLPGTEITNFNATWRIRHSLTDSNTVFVASEDGFFVSRDGGEFFEQLLFGSASDVEIRKNGEMYVGLKNIGVYYSPDGQDNFVKVSYGLPASFGRIELSITESDSAFLIAALENTGNGQLLDLYSSSNNGVSWEIMPNPADGINATANFAWYCHALFIHPENKDFIIYGASRGAYSTNGGNNWSRLLNVHADLHSFTMNPKDVNQVFVTSDGGVNRFQLLGGSELVNLTKHNEGLNITQFYTGAVFPNGNVLGGTQDNGTWFGNRESKEFFKVSGADGAGCQVNLDNPTEIYVSYQRAYIFRVNNFGNFPLYNHISEDILYSGDDQYFIAPVILNQDNPNELFVPTVQRMWYSNSKGSFWQHFTAEAQNLYAMEFTEHDGKRAAFISGSSATLLRVDDLDTHVAGDETDLSSSAPFEVSDGFMRDILLHPIDEDVLYVVFSSFSSNDRVWKISDIWSESPVWESISGNLPEFLPVNTIAVNERDPKLMAIGTDFGLFTTINEGENWELEEAIPQTVIFQLELQDTLLSIFTHGRGIFQAEMRDLPVSVNEVMDQSDFTISPNPASSFIDIHSSLDNKDMTFVLRAMDGTIIMQRDFENRIDISQIPTGVYLAQMTGNEQMASQKIIIQR